MSQKNEAATHESNNEPLFKYESVMIQRLVFLKRFADEEVLMTSFSVFRKQKFMTSDVCFVHLITLHTLTEQVDRRLL